MQINPTSGIAPGLPKGEIVAALCDAQDNLGWARDLIEALQNASDRPTIAVAHHALDRLETAEILASLKKGVAA